MADKKEKSYRQTPAKQRSVIGDARLMHNSRKGFVSPEISQGRPAHKPPSPPSPPKGDNSQK